MRRLAPALLAGALASAVQAPLLHAGPAPAARFGRPPPGLSERAKELWGTFLSPEPTHSGAYAYMDSQFADLKGGESVPDFEAWSEIFEHPEVEKAIQEGEQAFERHRASVDERLMSALGSRRDIRLDLPALAQRSLGVLLQAGGAPGEREARENEAERNAREEMDRRYPSGWEGKQARERELQRIRTRIRLTPIWSPDAGVSKKALDRWKRRTLGELRRADVANHLFAYPEAAQAFGVRLGIQPLDRWEDGRGNAFTPSGEARPITARELAAMPVHEVENGSIYLERRRDWQSLLGRSNVFRYGTGNRYFALVNLDEPRKNYQRFLTLRDFYDQGRSAMPRNPAQQEQFLLLKRTVANASFVDSFEKTIDQALSGTNDPKTILKRVSLLTRKAQERLGQTGFTGSSSSGIQEGVRRLEWYFLSRDPSHWQNRDRRAESRRAKALKPARKAERCATDGKDCVAFGRSRRGDPSLESMSLDGAGIGLFNVGETEGETLFDVGILETHVKARPLHLEIFDPDDADRLVPFKTAPGEVAFSVDAARKVRAPNGRLVIPSAPGFEISAIRLTDAASGKDWVEGTDYSLYRVHGTQRTLLVASIPESREFQLGINYTRQEARLPTAPPELTRLDPVRVRALVTELRKAEFHPLADELAEALRRTERIGAHLSADDVAALVSGHGSYSLEPETDHWVGTGELREFSRFLDREKRLCTSCSPSNKLFGKMMAFVTAGSGIELRERTLLLISGDKIRAPLHADTGAYREGRLVAAFDATPGSNIHAQSADRGPVSSILHHAHMLRFNAIELQKESARNEQARVAPVSPEPETRDRQNPSPPEKTVPPAGKPGFWRSLQARWAILDRRKAQAPSPGKPAPPEEPAHPQPPAAPEKPKPLDPIPDFQAFAREAFSIQAQEARSRIIERHQGSTGLRDGFPLRRSLTLLRLLEDSVHGTGDLETARTRLGQQFPGSTWAVHDRESLLRTIETLARQELEALHALRRAGERQQLRIKDISYTASDLDDLSSVLEIAASSRKISQVLLGPATPAPRPQGNCLIETVLRNGGPRGSAASSH